MAHSFTNSPPPSKARKLMSDDENSWNFYIERFYNSDIDDDETCFSSSSFSSSLVVSKGRCFENLSSKNRKRKRHLAYHDDALEDTASSPLKSPKGKVTKEPLKVDEKIKELGVCGNDTNNLAVKAIILRDLRESDECNHGSIFIESDHKKGSPEITALKKKGLCLLPVSLVAKYIKIG